MIPPEDRWLVAIIITAAVVILGIALMVTIHFTAEKDAAFKNGYEQYRAEPGITLWRKNKSE